MFKKIRSLKIKYFWQVWIRTTCLLHKEMPIEIQHKINNLCLECGAEYYQALFEAMTTTKSLTEISLKYYLSERTLYRIRNKFYESW